MAKNELIKPELNVELKAEVKALGEVEHNFDKAKEFAVQLKNHYEQLIFKEEDIDIAKKERAGINKMVKKIDDYRKSVVAEFKKPIDDFEETAKSVARELKGASEIVDKSVKDYEQKKIDEKMKLITKYVQEKTAFEDFEFILEADSRWENKGYELETIYEEVDTQIENKKKEIELDKTNIELIELYAGSKNVDSKPYIVEYNYCKDVNLVKAKIDLETQKVEEKKVETIVADAFSDSPVMVSKTFTATQDKINLLIDYAKSIGIDTH